MTVVNVTYTLALDSDSTLSPIGEPFGHAATAREAATAHAARIGESVLIVVAGRPRLVVSPDGRVAPPSGVVPVDRAHCVRDSRTCFCVACREDRRAGA